MKAEIIAVGSELLTPDRLDTNSLYLSEKLGELGIDLIAKVIVGDDEAMLERVARESLSRAELVIAIGGLGPTEDDVTRQVLARIFQRGLVLDESILENLRQRFAARGLTMPENNVRQAMIPTDARVLENARGTAPGLWLTQDDKHAILLPGPPGELKVMFERCCMERLRALAGNRVIRTRVYKATGLTESHLDECIATLYKNYRNPSTTILANPGEIEIRLRATADSEREALSLLEELGRKIEVALGDHIFSRGERLEEVVGRLLGEHQKTVAVAESCTGGLLAERMTEVSGSSKYFLGGVICYSNEVKMSWLGVPTDVLETHGAVSREVAETLARAVREQLGSDFGIGITGIAGPTGGSPEKPVGLVHLALASATEVKHREFNFPGDRQRIRWQATQAALNLLRKILIREK